MLHTEYIKAQQAQVAVVAADAVVDVVPPLNLKRDVAVVVMKIR